MRFLLVIVFIFLALVSLSYCTVISEHSVLTQIETSIASPEAMKTGPLTPAGEKPSSSTEETDTDTSLGRRLFRFGARNDDVSAFDIAGDADEIGFNCPFGIEAIDLNTIAIVDPTTDRLLIYSLPDDKITATLPLKLSENYDVIAAVADGDTLLFGERSLAGRGELLRRLSLNGEASDTSDRTVYADELSEAIKAKLASRGFFVSSQTQPSADISTVRSTPTTGTVSSVTDAGDVTRVDYEIKDGRFLTLKRQFASGEIREETVHARRAISVVRPNDVDRDGNIYLSITEELLRSDAYRSDQTIIMLPADPEKSMKLYYVPRSRVCTPRQNTAVLPDGHVVSIFVRRNDVSLVRLKPKSEWQWRLRTARDTTGVFLVERFRNRVKPVDKLAARYPDYAPPSPRAAEVDSDTAPDAETDGDTPSARQEETPAEKEPATNSEATTEDGTDGSSEQAANSASETMTTQAPQSGTNDEERMDNQVTETDRAAQRTMAYANALEKAFTRVSSNETIDRRSIVRNACLYLNIKYTMGPSNYEPETAFHYGAQSTVTSACASRGNHNLAFWSRPKRLSGREGEEITSVPYVWAGSDWPWQFVQKISAGRPAGDVCTKIIIYDAKSSVNSIYAAGVDCSGFVSRAWGRNARYTTSNLADASEEIALEDLKPGDILNKAGNHVVMFLSWRNSGELEVIEATTNSACGGVCARTRRIEEFQGYRAYRARHVDQSQELSAAEVEEICQSATAMVSE
ncbi:MAG: hypothetical protein AAF720_12365 [Pseudomonadota bacterium]